MVEKKKGEKKKGKKEEITTVRGHTRPSPLNGKAFEMEAAGVYFPFSPATPPASLPVLAHRVTSLVPV